MLGVVGQGHTSSMVVSQAFCLLLRCLRLLLLFVLLVFCLHILFPDFVFLWVVVFLIFALLCICWFLFE